MSRPIAVWWRDDDAEEDTSTLQRLLALKRQWTVPLALAAVPSKAKPSLANVVQEPDTDFLVHGYAHTNRANAGERKTEFPAARNLADMRTEWASGLEKLRRIVPRALPVFVPPWNSFPLQLMAGLRQEGYCGFSAWGPESRWIANHGLTVASTHLDVLDWRSEDRTKPARRLIAELEALSASGAHSLRLPIGLLTHHRQMPDEAFAAVNELFAWIARSEDFVWTSARSIFATPG